MSTAIARTLAALHAANGSVPRSTGAGQWMTRCPAHADKTPSLSVKADADGRVALHCFAGCETAAVLDAAGLTFADLFDGPRDPAPAGRDAWMPCGHRRVAEYEYHDELGRLLYGVARCDRKGDGCGGFAQWRPDLSRKNGRRWSLKDDAGDLAVRLVPYHLPRLLAAVADHRVVWVVEGEKDVHFLDARPGITATCNPMGAGKWRPDFARYFEGADVVICADRDEPGKRHAEQVAANLCPVVNSLDIVVARHGKDPTDHLEAGGTTANFVHVAEIKAWTPTDAELAQLLAGGL